MKVKVKKKIVKKVPKVTATGILNKLQARIETMMEDAEKMDSGVKAPAPRIRKGLSELGKACKDARVKILEMKQKM
jgi:hypothetical protein